MPEPPDFDQIARAAIRGPEWGEEYDREPMVQAVTEQLRLVWNARGAADVAKLDAVLPLIYVDRTHLDGWLSKHLDRALRTLDR